MRRGNLLDRHHTVHRANATSTSGSSAAERQSRLTAHQLHPVRIIKDGEVKYRNAWVTDLVPTTDNIVQLVRGNWKIENEAFNT